MFNGISTLRASTTATSAAAAATTTAAATFPTQFFSSETQTRTRPPARRLLSLPHQEQ